MSTSVPEGYRVIETPRQDSVILPKPVHGLHDLNPENMKLTHLQLMNLLGDEISKQFIAVAKIDPDFELLREKMKRATYLGRDEEDFAKALDALVAHPSIDLDREGADRVLKGYPAAF